MLRSYQANAVAAVCARWESVPRRGSLVVLPTGAGKTHVLSELAGIVAARWRGRSLIMAHIRELVVQSEARLRADGLDVGVWCAGLGRREAGHAVTVGTVRSVRRAAALVGPVHLLVIDEAHRIPPRAESLYRSLIAALQAQVPGMLIVGLTATPYRMDSGMIASPDGPLHDIVHETSVDALVRDGWLSPSVFLAGQAQADLTAVKISGDFVLGEQAEAFEAITSAATREAVQLAAGRQKCLVFCAGVDQAERVAAELRALGETACCVHGRLTVPQRDAALAAFRSAAARWAVNCQVLTEGFDEPSIDCVVLLRATVSPGLYYQMVGRGFRRADGKADCLVIDFGGNSRRHGPIGDIKAAEARGRPQTPPADDGQLSPRSGQSWRWQTCARCRRVVDAWADTCPGCSARLESRLDRQDAPSEDTSQWVDVCMTIVSKHVKKRAQEGDPPTMRVTYMVDPGERRASPTQVEEWVCLEHPYGSYARQKAVRWWAEHATTDTPVTIDDALQRQGELTWPDRMLVEQDAPWWRIKQLVRLQRP